LYKKLEKSVDKIKRKKYEKRKKKKEPMGISLNIGKGEDKTYQKDQKKFYKEMKRNKRKTSDKRDRIVSGC
jgi:hypothetical protein